MRRPPKNGVLISEEIKTLLVDGNALFKTGYHGAITDFNAEGKNIGGIYQFITVIRRLIDENYYHRVFVFWDGKFSGKMRWEIYKDYKGNRNKDYINGTEPDDKDLMMQRLIVQQYLEELFIRQLEDEIVESDDFIAYFCKTKRFNEKITICTNDRDLCQLINEDVKIYLCDKKFYVTQSNYQDTFKHHQRNSVLIKQISGDTSDCIKGIKGVGEKTLLEHFPILTQREATLEEILEQAKAIQESRKEKKLKPLQAITNLLNGETIGIQGKEIYKINKRLVDLSIPMITESAMSKLNELRDGCLDPEDRGVKNVYTLMKRDGLDKRIANYSAEYFMPFKRLIEREKKLFNKNLSLQ